MRVIAKDRIRFAVRAASGTPAELEVRVSPDRFGGWQTVAVGQASGGAPSVALGRVLRSSDRRLATSKMVALGALTRCRSATARRAPGGGGAQRSYDRRAR